MDIKLDLLTKTLTTFSDNNEIYVGDINADKLRVFVIDDNELINEGYLSITGLLSNGRKIGHYTTDSSYHHIIIDDVKYVRIEFTLTKANGFTLSEGQLNLTLWYNKTKTDGTLLQREAVGNILINVKPTATIDDVLLMTDNNGDVVFNFINELQNIQARISDIDSKYVRRSGDTLNGTLYTEADTPYLIGTENKVGIRAQDKTTGENVGQFSISDSDIEKYKGHWANMTTKGNDGNNYSIRVSALGPQYKDGATGTTYNLAFKEDVEELIRKTTDDNAISTIYIGAENTRLRLYGSNFRPMYENDNDVYELALFDDVGVINLGPINESPMNAENTVLNEVKTKGMYSFTYGGRGLLMFVKTGRTGQANTYNQTIIDLTNSIEKNIIIREANSVRNEWTITTKKIAFTDYVEERIKQLLGDDVSTAYDTFKEIQQYIEAHGTQASEMVNAINTNTNDIARMKAIIEDLRIYDYTYKENGTEATVEGNTLVLSNAEVEGNTLEVSGATVEGNTLII